MKSGVLGTLKNPHNILVALSTHVSILLHGKYEICRYQFGMPKEISLAGDYVKITTINRTYRTKIGVASTSDLVNDVFHILYKVLPIEVFASLVRDFVNSSEGQDEWLFFESILMRLIRGRARETTNVSAWDLLNNPTPIEVQKPVQTNPMHFLQHAPIVLIALHLLYEDLKLNTLRWEENKKLCRILVGIAKTIGWSTYVTVYERECGPQNIEVENVYPVCTVVDN